MPTPQELEARFWKALGSDRTMMLGLSGVDESHARPMTAHTEDARSPIWFFTASDTTLAQQLSGPQAEARRAFATFAAKDHDLFAVAHGTLSIDNDRATIDRLWNPYVAAWYEGGRNDPKVTLLRFDADEAQVWENAHSLIEGVKMLFGRDPKKDVRDKVANVNLH